MNASAQGNLHLWARNIASFALFTLATPVANAQLPSDVRSSHWAAGAVKQVLANHVMPLGADKQFHGEAHATRQEAVMAIAALAKQLESGTWHKEPVQAVPEKVSKVLNGADWKTRTVTRYEMASVLARLGNYYAEAVPRPALGAKNLGKSAILASKISIGVPTTSPAYPALRYLADSRMIAPGADLLTADATLVKALAFSTGVAQMAAGLVDKMTELGQESDGSTPDASFHNRKTASPAAAPKK